MFERLLAKSTATPATPLGAELLGGHSLLVFKAAESLLSCRLAESMAATGLPISLSNRLASMTRFAALIHDLGKCSVPFQKMVRGDRAVRQPIRHEALTLWLCWPGQSLHGFLSSGSLSEEDYLLALVAAAGHHRKFWAQAFAPDDAGAGSSCELLVNHPDFVALLSKIRSESNLRAPVPDLVGSLTASLVGQKSIQRDFRRWAGEFEDVWTSSAEIRALGPPLKAFVLAADVAGSALPREGVQASSWIPTQLAQRANAVDFSRIVDLRLGGHPPRPFQERVAASSDPVTMVRAGCGTGKTAAAWLWAARNHAGRQLWLTYPTTGTATEGFRDYAAQEGADLVARLEHSRAHVDLELFGLDDGAADMRELDRLDALRNWGSQVVTCTVDTVLGLIQNQRKGVYAWPALVHAAIVFDEIHAYDDLLFGSLVRFLEAMPGIPALLMTASLPVSRLDALRAVVARVHHRELPVIEGPADLEQLPRYRRSISNPWALAAETVNSGGKVLWVSNTVARARAVAADATNRGHAPRLYHSRYRYVDRVRRHGDVIEAFAHDGAAFACTTQVAEMSLDLSADLLVTDLAPIPALIQRLGRLNRRATPSNPGLPRHFVIVDFDGLPYEEDELFEANRWLTALPTERISQEILTSTWIQRTSPVLSTSSAWLDGGFETIPAELRESDVGLTVLLERDVPVVRADPRRLTELVVPMNRCPFKDWISWPREGAVRVAPASTIAYDEMTGGTWAR